MRFIAQKGRALLVMMTAAVLAVIGLAGCAGAGIIIPAAVIRTGRIRGAAVGTAVLPGIG